MAWKRARKPARRAAPAWKRVPARPAARRPAPRSDGFAVVRPPRPAFTQVRPAPARAAGFTQLTPQQAAAAERQAARRYALMRLQQLSKTGLGATPGRGDIGLSQAASLAMQSNDPAAAWRALSAQMMEQFHGAGGQGDPNAWIKQQIAAERERRRQAALQAASAAGHGIPGTAVPV